MTRYQNSFVGTDDTPLTAANSLSGGDQLQVIGAPLYDTAQSFEGSTSLKLTGASATAQYVFWNITATEIAMRTYLYLTGNVASDYSVLRAYDGASNVLSASVAFAPGSKLRFYGASSAVIGTAASVFPTNQWVRIEMRGTGAAGTADVACAYYLGNSTTPVDPPITSTAATTSAAGFTSARAGKLVAATGADHWIDMLAVDTAPGGAFIGGTVLDIAGVVDATGWTLLGGGTALGNLTDNDPLTGLVSGTNPVGQTVRFLLPSLLPPGSADFTVPCEGYRGGGGTSGSVTGYVYDGNTLKATSNTVSLAAANAPFVLTFPAADHADIDAAAWASGALELRLVVAAS